MKNHSFPQLKVGWKPAIKYLLILSLVFGLVMFAYDLKYQPPRSTSVTNFVNANVVLNPGGSANTTIMRTSQSTSQDLILDPVSHVLFIMNYHGPQGLVINEPYAPYQYAWNWVLPVDISPAGVVKSNGTATVTVDTIQVNFDPFNSPTYYRVDVDVGVGGVVTHYIPIWYRAQANLALWWGFIPALVAFAWALLKKRETLTATFFGTGIIANYLPWLILSLAVRRIGFNYYFIFTTAFVALGLTFLFKNIKYGKLLMVLDLVAALAFFVAFFPVKPMP